MSFEILYSFKTPTSRNYSVFFTDGDNIFRTSINVYTLDNLTSQDKASGRDDKLQGYLRKRYDYHKDSVDKIDAIEINGLYEHFKQRKDDSNKNKVWMVMRNRKIDDILK